MKQQTEGLDRIFTAICKSILVLVSISSQLWKIKSEQQLEKTKISEYLTSKLGDEEIKEDKSMKRFEIAMLTAQAE